LGGSWPDIFGLVNGGNEVGIGGVVIGSAIRIMRNACKAIWNLGSGSSNRIRNFALAPVNGFLFETNRKYGCTGKQIYDGMQ